jgi:hypothetical protein
MTKVSFVVYKVMKQKWLFCIAQPNKTTKVKRFQLACSLQITGKNLNTYFMCRPKLALNTSKGKILVVIMLKKHFNYREGLTFPLNDSHYDEFLNKNLRISYN